MQEIDVPRTKPAAPKTWELRESLDADTIQSARVSIDFPGPYLIVGAYVSVSQTTNAGDGSLLVPTADDILVLLDLNNEQRFTNADLVGNDSIGEQFSTLAALDTRYRDLHIVMDTPKPVLGAVFRWKAGAGADGLFEDCMISLSFICGSLKDLSPSR